MLKIHSEPPKPPLTASGPALFALGFRPFFAAAGLAAIVLIGIWLAAWSGRIDTGTYYGAIGWHSHEMLFGYTTAVIAGFLLTAVRNWTGVNTSNGPPLVLLTLLWLVGRLAPAFAGTLPPALIAITDLLFLPTVVAAIAPPLWQGEQKINRIFIPVLLSMALANLLVHLQALGVADTAARGTDLMLYLIILLLIILSGRVMPFFTRAVIPGHTPKQYPLVDKLTLAALGILVLELLLLPTPWLTALLTLTLALTQIMRLFGWYDRRIWRIPILWVLYTGFFWIITGLLLTTLAQFDLISINLARHALTLGGIGITTFGMMARVSLGHTGRPIDPSPAISLGFVLLNLAAAARVFGPMLLPEKYNLWIHISGGLWVISFLLFVVIYLPMLGRPRVDGKAG